MPGGFLGQQHTAAADDDNDDMKPSSPLVVNTLAISPPLHVRKALQATSQDIKRLVIESSSLSNDHSASSLLSNNENKVVEVSLGASASWPSPTTGRASPSPDGAAAAAAKPSWTKAAAAESSLSSLPPPPPPKESSFKKKGLVVRRALRSLVPKPVKKAVQTTVRIMSAETTPLLLLSNNNNKTTTNTTRNNDHHHASSSSSLPLDPTEPSTHRSVDASDGARYHDGDFWNDDDDNNSLLEHPEENPPRLQARQRARDAWRRIAGEVRSGDMLLRADAMDPHRMSSNKISVDERERQRRQALEWIRKGVEFNLMQCIVAVLLYIVIAIGAFSFVFHEWTIIDSAYFAIVTFTTIGYGDLVPDTYVLRIFTCFFALSGVACLGIAIGVIGNNVMEAQEAAVKQTKTLAQNRVFGLFQKINDGNNQEESRTPEGDPSRDDDGADSSSSSSNSSNSKMNPVWQLLLHFSFVLFILVIFAFAEANDPGIDVTWNIFDALYFAIITATTVGYGDFAPQTQRGRLLAIVFIPLCVGAMGNFLGSVATVIMESRRSSFHKHMDAQELSLQDLEIMDENGDGEVTRAEFLEFMLIAMNKVDKDFIDEVRRSFARLDVDDTGTLSKGDLVAAARSKLQSNAKKLELAAYRETLLLQAEQARREKEAAMMERRSSVWQRMSFVKSVRDLSDREKGASWQTS